MYWKRSRQQFLHSALIRRRFWALAALFIVLVLSLLQSPIAAHAFQVPQLPSDNLLQNPWFRDPNNPNEPGFHGWTRNNGVTWGPSQKESNPSPDKLTSADCGNKPDYCGTAARWAEQSGVTYPNITVTMYQVVKANPAHHKLVFFTHWVSHRVDAASVKIYGSNSGGGPWTEIWAPFYHSQDKVIYPPSGNVADLWEVTGFVEKTIPQGFNYYKVEFQARLPEGDGVGFKATGVYFATKGGNGSVAPLSHVYLPFLRRSR